MVWQEKFDKTISLKTFEYVNEKNTFNRYCNRCGSPVLISGNKSYSFQCMTCDEDLYEIETHLGDVFNQEDFEKLLMNTRDILLLDCEVK